MAALVKDSDFIHRLIRDRQRVDLSSAVVEFANVAELERNFNSFPLSHLDSIRNADILILKTGKDIVNRLIKEHA